MKISKKISLRVLIIGIISLILVTVNAIPELVSEQSAYASCTEKQTNKKSFVADTEKISIGEVCQRDARVILYECQDNDCNSKTKIAENYKRNDSLIPFTKFDLNKKYYYECFSCENAPVVKEESTIKGKEPVVKDKKCAITVTEGEKVSLKWQGSDPDKEVGPQGKLTYKYEGVVGESGQWQTKRGDAGIYQVKAKIFDGEYTDEISLCIEVLKKNTAPKVNVSATVKVYEGETIKLSAVCTDAEGDKTTIAYTGWMTADTRTTSYEDAREYSTVINCKDQFNDESSAAVKITVLNKNRPPKITWVASN